MSKKRNWRGVSDKVAKDKADQETLAYLESLPWRPHGEEW